MIWAASPSCSTNAQSRWHWFAWWNSKLAHRFVHSSSSSCASNVECPIQHTRPPPLATLFQNITNTIILLETPSFWQELQHWPALAEVKMVASLTIWCSSSWKTSLGAYSSTMRSTGRQDFGALYYEKEARWILLWWPLVLVARSGPDQHWSDLSKYQVYQKNCCILVALKLMIAAPYDWMHMSMLFWWSFILLDGQNTSIGDNLVHTYSLML